ncbi:hypothetical protein AB0M86_35995 [Streptomyces sp. NPDC051639]|uniref:hypothetical protein n=1 Tax=Streptomyces sp. NPDC051639 TaxID=3155671 RepID=UPI003421F282
MRQLPSTRSDIGLSSASAKRYRPGPGSSGEIAVRLHRGPGDTWVLTTRYRLRLLARDPLAAKLREEPDIFSWVADLLPGGHATVTAAEELGGSDNAAPDWCTLSQGPMAKSVTVTAEHTETDVYGSLGFGLSDEVRDIAGHAVPLAPGHWAWSVEAPAPWGFRISGQPDRQTDHSVEIGLPSAKTTAVTLLLNTEQPATDLTDSHTTARGVEGVLSLLALLSAGAAVFMGLVRDCAAPAERRVLIRGAVLVLALLAVSATCLFVWDLVTGTWDELSWLQSSGLNNTSNFPRDGTPAGVPLQGALLAAALFSLPLLVVCAAHARRPGGPPATRHVLALALPAPLLLGSARVIGGARWNGPAATDLVAASAAAALVFLLLRLLPPRPPFRPWAPAMAAVTWATVSASVVLDWMPAQFDAARARTGLVRSPTYGTTLGSWPALVVLLLPWAVAFLVLAGPLMPSVGHRGRAARAALVPLLITALLPWWAPEIGFTSEDSRPPFNLILQLVGQWTGRDFLVGVSALAPALQVIWLLTAALLLTHLHNSGRVSGRWLPSARGSCVALLLLAASAPIAGAPESWLPHATTTGAVLTAWAGTHVLLPPRDRPRAARLHALTGAAHARLLRSLARALLYAEGRHRFLTASRGTLADASVSPGQWEETWRSLRAPTAADAARETAWLRSVALGGSGGRTAWSNGVAAAAACALLTLPWTAWPAWQGRGYSGLPEAVTVAGGTTAVWLAHGFTYGYLYPWIRGRGPVSKAGWLWAVMTPVQLLLLKPRLRLPFDQAALTVFLLLAQSAVMALGLALFWEVRLVHRADLLWGHVRNFRRLSSLAAPVSTVLVAAVTAAVTVLATAWADNLTTPEQTPSPAPSSSVSPPSR